MPPEGTPQSAADELQTRPAGGRLFSGLRVVSLCTLLSRVLGLIRDMLMAALFGNGMVFDAFSVAVRLPNMARRLFGEGALTAAFLPAFVKEMEHAGKDAAARLATALFVVLAIVLTLLVVAGEVALGGAYWLGGFGEEAELLIGLTAVMLPYLVLICLAAQVSSVLHALGHFTWPALLPVLLNVVWIVAICCVAVAVDGAIPQIYWISFAIVLAGVLQLFAPLPMLRRLGIQYQTTWRAAGTQIKEISLQMLPVIVGLSITQINSLGDSLIAWGFSQPHAGQATMPILDGVAYPLRSGTASALYFGQRLYHFPLGVFGVALGTVLFPLLSRHAGRGELHLLRDDLSLGLRLVLVVCLPASLGLFQLAEPLTALLFQRGRFSAEDAVQTSQMIAAYGVGVWAYCGLLIVNRAYYAVGERQTPMKIGMIAVAFNLVLNLTLIWYLGGPGLAVSTSLAAILQLGMSAWYLQDCIGSLDWSAIGLTFAKCLLATLLMGLACHLTQLRFGPSDTLAGRFTSVVCPFAASVAVYFAAAYFLRLNEFWQLFRGERK